MEDRRLCTKQNYWFIFKRVREHRDLYARAIFHGFEVEDGKEGA